MPMKTVIKRIFLCDTIVAGFFGFCLIAFPGELLSVLAMAPEPGSIVLARLLGGSLLGIGATEWLSRNASESDSLPIIRGLLWFDIVAVVVSMNATLSRTANSLGWLIAGFFFLFAVARVFVSVRQWKTVV